MTHPKDTPPATQTIRVRVEDVVVPSNRRRLRGVAELAASMADVGQIHPITIRPDRSLVAGLHRLEAARSLGWEDLAATVITVDDLRAKLIEIDENLQRAEFSHLERGNVLAERKEVYEALHPETRSVTQRGGPGRGNKTDADSALVLSVPFVRATADRIGKSERSIQEDIQIAEKIAPKVKEAIRDAPIAENKGELLALARLSPGSQEAVTPLLAQGDVTRVVDAQSALLRKRREQEAATGARLYDAAGPTSDETQDRLVAAYARLALSYRSGLLALDPELVATCIPVRDRHRLSQLASDSAEWFALALASFDKPLRIVGGSS